MKKVKVDANLLIRVTENHGGYLAVECILCKASGWDGKLEHEPGCEVGKALKHKFRKAPND